ARAAAACSASGGGSECGTPRGGFCTQAGTAARMNSQSTLPLRFTFLLLLERLMLGYTASIRESIGDRRLFLLKSLNKTTCKGKWHECSGTVNTLFKHFLRLLERKSKRAQLRRKACWCVHRTAQPQNPAFSIPCGDI